MMGFYRLIISFYDCWLIRQRVKRLFVKPILRQRRDELWISEGYFRGAK